MMTSVAFDVFRFARDAMSGAWRRFADPMRAPLAAVPAVVLVVALAGCSEDAAVVEDKPRPVRVITVSEGAAGEVVTLSGVIEAKNEVDLAFRIGGRIVERAVNVGDRVEAGQLIARLDSQDEQNAVRAARSELSAAEGQYLEAERNHDRQRQLLERGHTTKQRFDEAVQVLGTLRSRVDSAAAQLAIAENRLSDTALYADAEGEITARNIEVGQVVQPGQTIVRIARKDGRDAVFDAPANLISIGRRDADVTIALTIDPAVQASGRIREVSPQADPLTGSFRVRVGIKEPPPEMRLGSTVAGRMTLARSGGLEIPASALSRAGGLPAVWIFDPATETVNLRTIEVSSHRPSEIIVSGGLAPGDVVVTAGVQSLLPGQRVRLVGQRS